MRPALIAALVLAVAAPSAGDAASRWRALPDGPHARSEVAAAAVAGRVAVVAGFTAGGVPSPRADAWSPGRRRWSRLPDLPIALHHPMAAAADGRLYVLGGYTGGSGFGVVGRRAFSLDVAGGARRWRELPRMPAPRAAGGAAVVGGRVYVLGGVERADEPRLATRSLVYDPRSRRWRQLAGVPTPREHLGVATVGGRVHVLGGRQQGIDTNLRAHEAYDVRTGRWSRLPDLPNARGGSAAAAVGARIVTLGGEEPAGTIASVDAYDPRTRRWTALPASPAPRHGVGVAALGGRLYQLLGGPEPGLHVSKTALVLDPS